MLLNNKTIKIISIILVLFFFLIFFVIRENFIADNFSKDGVLSQSSIFQIKLLRISLLVAGVFFMISFIFSKKFAKKLEHCSDKKLIKKIFLLSQISMILIILFLMLMLIFTNHFNSLQMEDGLMEYATFGFLFLSSLIMFFSFIKLGKGKKNIAFLLFGLLFLFVSMEEISFGQRILGINTPSYIKSNAQNEINIHNINTSLSERSYYFCAFLFLIVFPFLGYKSIKIKLLERLRHLIPNINIIIISSIAFSFNGLEKLTLIDIEVAFFLTILILGSLIYYKSKRDSELPPWLILIVFFISVILVQIILLKYSYKFGYPDVPSEYKEFFISIGFFIYSLQILTTK